MADAEFVEIGTGRLKARIARRGSELKGLRTGAGVELLWHADPAWWDYSAPLLFPIVGKTRDGRYRHEGKVYEMPQHGLARLHRFELLGATPAECRMRLDASDADLAAYPFRYRLEVTHAITGATLTTTVRIENRDTSVMPASVGFHPGFLWPVRGSTRDGHHLDFEKPEPAPLCRPSPDALRRRTSERLPLDGGRLTLRDEHFAAGAMILDPVASASVTYGDRTGSILKASWTGCPVLAIWTRPGAPFFCIEPWHGYLDPEDFHGDLMEKPGMHHIAPGAAATASMSVEVLID